VNRKSQQRNTEAGTELAVVQQYRPEPSPELLRTVATLPRRDLAVVTENIRSFIMADPHIARRCLYCKPVGKKDNRQHFSVGPSVRFSELAMQQFGDMWLRSYLVDEVPAGNNGRGSVTTETVLFDLQTRNIYTAQDTSPIWNVNQAETARDRSFSFSRRDSIMQAVRPQWEKIERDVKRTVVLSFIAGETPPKDDTPEKKDLRAQKAMWAFIVQRFNDLGAKIDPKDENNVLMKITDDEHERIDRLYKLLGILNWLNDGNLDKIGDVLGNGYNNPGQKPRVSETKVADAPAAATTAAAPAAATAPAAAPTKREEFEQAVRGLAFKCGIDSADKLTAELQAEFEIAGGLAAVPEQSFNAVVDHFMAKSEKAA
jgi:hypothetical protein